MVTTSVATANPQGQPLDGFLEADGSVSTDTGPSSGSPMAEEPDDFELQLARANGEHDGLPPSPRRAAARPPASRTPSATPPPHGSAPDAAQPGQQAEGSSASGAPPPNAAAAGGGAATSAGATWKRTKRSGNIGEPKMFRLDAAAKKQGTATSRMLPGLAVRCAKVGAATNTEVLVISIDKRKRRPIGRKAAAQKQRERGKKTALIRFGMPGVQRCTGDEAKKALEAQLVKMLDEVRSSLSAVECLPSAAGRARVAPAAAATGTAAPVDAAAQTSASASATPSAPAPTPSALESAVCGMLQ